MNVVYKIGSCSIANRIKSILPSIINEDQTGFVKFRYIGDNIRLIFDIMSYLTSNNKPGLLLCLDFEKAFDSLDWGFLEKVLVAFGFKHDIRKWIQILYKDIKSAISVNGNISEWFTISRGCRQGDPVSPYLFIICAEIMAIMIRENKDIKGISINDIETKLTQYADDSEVLLEGDRKSFEETIQTVNRFSNISGLHLNTRKTNAIWLGSMRNSPIKYMQHLNISWNPDKFKILGIWFMNDLNECIDFNLKEKFNEIKKLYKIWSKRQVTPLGRVAVLKSLILSKLIYLWLLLPNPPDKIIQEIQNSIFKFIWNNKTDRISRKSAVKDVIEGGLGIPDLKRYISALKLTWIKKLETSKHPWKRIMYNLFPICNNLNRVGGQLPYKDYHLNIFWKNVFESYTKVDNITIVNSEEFLAEPLFYNKNILIGNSTVFYRNWFDSGVHAIKHFFDANGNFVTFNEFQTKLQFRETNFLKFNGCLQAIRKYINKCNIVISNNESDDTHSLCKIFKSAPNGAKHFYSLLSNNDVVHNCCNKWLEKLQVEIPWKIVFEKLKQIKDVKYKWFQIRIIHRIIATNVTLKAMNIKNNDMCTFCNEARESIDHLFVHCTLIQVFWNVFKELLIQENIVPDNFVFTPINILFGCTNEKALSNMLYYVILIAKFYIYKTRCEDASPTFPLFRKYLTNIFEIERFIAMKNHAIENFNDKWTDWDKLILTQNV